MLLIMIWSCDYHPIIIRLSEYNLIIWYNLIIVNIIWLSSDGYLKNISEGTDYHNNINKKINKQNTNITTGKRKKNRFKYDDHAIIIRWSSYVHIMIIWWSLPICYWSTNKQINKQTNKHTKIKYDDHRIIM